MTGEAWDPAYLDHLIGTFMGRDALALAASWLDLGADDAVLLPAYVCDEVVKPFARTSRVVLYDVQPDLSADPDLIEKMLAADPRIRMVLFVNYFGFLQPYRDEIRRICASRNVALIEDCAHSLLTAGSGDTGDFAVYSFRKILPIPDGGGLRTNKVTGRMNAPSFYPTLYSNALSVCISLKAALKLRTEAFSRAGLTKSTGEAVNRIAVPAKNGQSGPSTPRLLPLSGISRHAMKNLRYGDIVRKRRADYQFWQDLGASSGRFTPVTPSLSPGVCPLGFVANVPDREALRARSLKDGLYLRVHWRLPAIVGREHRHSHELSARSVTLPVYPELSERDRDLLVRLLSAPSRSV